MNTLLEFVKQNKTLEQMVLKGKLQDSVSSQSYRKSYLRGPGYSVEAPAKEVETFIQNYLKVDYDFREDVSSSLKDIIDRRTPSCIVINFKEDKISVNFDNDWGWLDYDRSTDCFIEFGEGCDESFKKLLEWVNTLAVVDADSVIISLPKTKYNVGLYNSYIVKDIGWCTATKTNDSIYNIATDSDSNIETVMFINLVSVLNYEVFRVIKPHINSIECCDSGYYSVSKSHAEAMKFLYVVARISQNQGFKANLNGRNIIATKGFSKEEALDAYNYLQEDLLKYPLYARIGNTQCSFQYSENSEKGIWKLQEESLWFI